MENTDKIHLYSR